MKNIMDKINEIRHYAELVKGKRFEVMITYDISGAYDDFYKEMYELVHTKRPCTLITKSHYLFNDLMTEPEIIELSKIIKELFNHEISLLESKDDKETVVELIRPGGDDDDKNDDERRKFKRYRVIDTRKQKQMNKID